MKSLYLMSKETGELIIRVLKDIETTFDVDDSMIEFYNIDTTRYELTWVKE